MREQERDMFQEMANRSNARQALNQSYRTGLAQNTISSTSAGDVPSFTYSRLFGAPSAGGQGINAAVDKTGTLLNHSTNTTPGNTLDTSFEK